MLERTLTLALACLVALSTLSGCAYCTKSGRQQLAYERYIRKCSGRKVKVVKVQAPRMPVTPAPSQEKVSGGVSDSPQSVSSGGDWQ